jgi:UDP-N-acetylmuramoyl-tripeptide--D-alanyl-D-alanine ligase
MLRLRNRLSTFTPYLLSVCAFFWRRLMFRTTFIAVTGSVGKSTATAALASVLSSHFSVNASPVGKNNRAALAQTVLGTRFRHRFTVIEVGTRAPGALRRAAWMIDPDVVLMLRVLNIHSNVFPTLDDMAAEKAQLLSRLGKRGVAIFNADDPRVLAMRERCRGPVRTFGLAPGSFMTASEISSIWPRRLSFRAECEGESALVQTSLVGEHMVYAALGALATAVHCGVPLAKAAECFPSIQPVPGRMQPMHLPNGATVLRDEFNSTLPALEAALDVLRVAEVSRRIVVLGDVLDSGLSERPRFRQVGTLAAQAADMAIFLGDLGKPAAKAAIAAGMPAKSALHFKTLQEAADFLRLEFRAGDLVLIHGWAGRHIERVILAQLGTLGCWVERCPKMRRCEDCSELKLVSIQNAVDASACATR